MKRIVVNDGDEILSGDVSEICANVDYTLAQDLLRELYAAREYVSASGFDPATLDAPTDTTTADAGGAQVRTYGFVGDGFRVVKLTGTSVGVVAGWGLQYGTSGVPTGESAVRFVRLATVGFGFTVAVAPAAQFRRDLVCAKWHTKATTALVNVMDLAGNVAPVTETVRTAPEVDDGGATTLIYVAGAAAGSAAGAARPAVPAGYVALAEVLVSATGLDNAANVDGVTPGLTDLRPRLVPRKAAGQASVRRATCSMDETTAVRSVRRWGAKGVGRDEVFGVAALPSASDTVVLDQSCDWRDSLVTVEFAQLLPDAGIPGGASDNSATFGTSTNVGGGAGAATPTMNRVMFYSGTGAVTYGSLATRNPIDHVNTTLTFAARNTDGALVVTGLAGVAATKNMIFTATRHGPLGYRPPAGVES